MVYFTREVCTFCVNRTNRRAVVRLQTLKGLHPEWPLVPPTGGMVELHIACGGKLSALVQNNMPPCLSVGNY